MKILLEQIKEELDLPITEDWRRTLGSAALATSLAIGGPNVSTTHADDSNSRTGSYSDNHSQHNKIVAEVIAGEGAGEGEIGMRAIACVIQNRGGNPVHVVTKPHQFSAYSDKALMARNYAEVKPIADKLASEIGRLNDITGGAKYYVTKSYYNKHHNNPHSWLHKMIVTKEIGNHIFMRDK